MPLLFKVSHYTKRGSQLLMSGGHFSTRIKLTVLQRIILYTIFAALVLSIIFMHRAAIPDDAMIYLRVAENIADGNGWSFNLGEIFNATTSPIHTLFLTSFLTTGLPPLNVLWLLYAIALALGGITLHLGLWPSHPIASFSAPLLITCWPVVQDSIGLETALMFALVALTSLAFRNGWVFSAGLLAGMVALTRPEGILMGPILVSTALITKLPWKGVILGWLIVLAAWFAFSWIQFSSFFPHTATIKNLQSEVPPWSTDGSWIVAFVQSLPAVSLIFALATLGIWRAWKHLKADLFVAVFLAFGLTQLFGYSVLSAPVGYWWYFAPGGIALIVAAMVGLDEIRDTFDMAMGKVGKLLSVAVPSSAFLAISLAFAATASRPLGDPYRLSAEYIRAAEWIRENSDPDASVAANEIGYLGYFSDRPIRDMLGLLHEEAVGPLSRHEWHWWLESEPDLVILHEPRWVGEPNSPPHPWPAHALADFENAYAPVYELPNLKVYEKSK